MALPASGMALLRKGRRDDAPAVIAVGPVLSRVLEASTRIDVTVIYLVTVRPLDREALARAVGGGDVVLAEPYLEGTSLGAVAAALQDRPRRLEAIGLQNVELRKHGPSREHQAAHGLDVAGLRGPIDAFLRERYLIWRGGHSGNPHGYRPSTMTPSRRNRPHFGPNMVGGVLTHCQTR